MPESIHPPIAESGVYRVNVGKFFYIGSSNNLEARRRDHHLNLRKGIHHSTLLQRAFNDLGTFEMVVIKEIPRKRDDSDRDLTQRLLLNEQWALNELIDGEFCCNTSLDAGFNSWAGNNLRKKWQDPEFRAKMSMIARSRPKTDAEKKKMAAAKIGGRNPRAKACTLRFNGETLRFPTGQAAADHFSVTQQAMDSWLRGLTPWPGEGARKPRPHNRWLVGLSGSYDGPL